MKKYQLFTGYVFLILIVILDTSFSQSWGKSGRNENEIIIRVAAGQFRVETDLNANVVNISNMLKQAAQDDVDIIVFPECGLTGYPPRDKDELDYVVQEKTEEALKGLQQQARKYDIAMAIGAAWKETDGLWKNRAFFITEDGKIVGHYDKVHNTNFEKKFFMNGTKLPVFNWRGIKVGLLICADMRYPEVWRLLRKDDVHLVLHCAAAFGNSEWKVPVLEGTLRCRAAENGYHIVSCNNAGPIPMMVSAIYNPDGLVLAKANYAMNELIVANIDVSILKGFIHYNENVYELIKTTKR